jgi:hypothetical protein
VAESHVTRQQVSRLKFAHTLFNAVMAAPAPHHEPAVRPIPKGIDRLGAVVICGSHEQKQNTSGARPQAQRCSNIASLRASYVIARVPSLGCGSVSVRSGGKRDV